MEEQRVLGPREYTPRPGDWFCVGCGANNFAYRVFCFRCGAKPPQDGAHPPGAPPLPWSPQSPKPGDWYCPDPACGNLNFARRTLCNKCHTPQPGFAEGYAAAMGGLAHNIGPMPGAGFEYTAPPKMPPQVMPGDWQCIHCANHNFARRVNCNRCGAPRDQSSVSPGPAANVAMAPPPALGGYGVLPTPVPGPVPGPRRRDRPVLDTAGPRPAAPPMVLSGDWVCPSPACGNINFARRAVCNRCQAPRPLEPTPPPPPHQ